MLKKKINNIIYSDELSDYEKEAFCTYYKGDSYDYGVYGAGWEFSNSTLEENCYQERAEQLYKEIEEFGVAYTLSLPISERNNKLKRACLGYLKDSFRLDSKWV